MAGHEEEVLFVREGAITDDDVMSAVFEGWDGEMHVQAPDEVKDIQTRNVVLILAEDAPGGLENLKRFILKFRDRLEGAKVAAFLIHDEERQPNPAEESPTNFDPVFYPLRESMATGRLFYEKRFSYTPPLSRQKRDELRWAIKDMKTLFNTEMKYWNDSTSAFWQRIFGANNDNINVNQFTRIFFSDLTPRKEFIRRFYRTTIRMILKLGFNLKIKGLENIPKKGPFLIAPNHCGHLDSPTVMCSLPRRVAYRTSVLIFKRFRSTPFRKSFADYFLKGVPIDRTDDFIPGLQVSSKILRQGYSLIVYPEGTRSVTGELQDFKIGIGVMAYELDVPILPVYIKGSFKAMPKGSSFPRLFNKLRIRFGKPISPDKFYQERGFKKSSTIYREIIDETRASIVNLQQAAGGE